LLVNSRNNDDKKYDGNGLGKRKKYKTMKKYDKTVCPKRLP